MSAFSIFVAFFVLSVVFCMCYEKVYLGSNFRPSIFYGFVREECCVVYS